jgi:hypothetical protein
VKHLLNAIALAFGLAILCGTVTSGCGEAINSAVHNKANFARQNKDNRLATVPSGDAFFTVRNYKVVATSATTPHPAQAAKRDSSLNHWQLE